ncbi:MAG TPA: hypothetical protein VGE76_01420 [Opitutaceae bacterium]
MAADPEAASASAPSVPPAPSRWLHRLTGPAAALLVLALFYGALLASLRDTSATFDEPGHAAAGYVYWKYGDYRSDPENGNLSKRWIALPLLLRSDTFPAPGDPAWQSNSLWFLSDAWFNRLGNDTAGMLAAGRAFAGLTAVALGVVIWLWSRRLFGPLGGMISLLLYALSPIVLANGALMTSDLPTALGFVASLGCIWALLQRVTLVRVVGGVLAIAGLFLAKMSAPLVIPMAALLAAARLIDGRPWPVGRWLLARRLHQAAALAVLVLIQTLGVVVLVWAAYGFRYSAFAAEIPGPQRFKEPWEWYLGYPRPGEVVAALKITAEQEKRILPRSAVWGGGNADWSHFAVDDFAYFRKDVFTPEQIARLDALMRPSPELFPTLVGFAREHRLLPESFIAGYAHVWKTAGSNSTFLNGKVADEGRASYFPFVFLVKTPLPFFALLGVAAALTIFLWRSRRAGAAEAAARTLWRGLYPVLPLLVLFGVYWATMLRSKLNIGHRHLLPTYPPLFIAAGVLALLWVPAVAATIKPVLLRRLRWAALGLGAVLVVEIACRFPLYIAYFNGIVEPDRAHRHVVDSSLDWGQELPAVARYLKLHPQEKAYFAYFGVGEPENYGIDAQFIGGMHGSSQKVYLPMMPLLDTSNEKILEYVKKHPKYSDRLFLNLNSDGDRGLNAALVQRGSTHRLGPGLYVISATMLQGVYHGKAGGPWRPELEDYYRRYGEMLRPFLEDDAAGILRIAPQVPLAVWNTAFEDFYNIRLSRLTAYLRKREPLHIINHAVLVYRLTAAEVDQALNGPVTP